MQDATTAGVLKDRSGRTAVSGREGSVCMCVANQRSL